MAFVDSPTAQLTYVMVDAKGKRGTFQLDVPWGTLAAEAIAAASVFRVLVEAVSGCKCVSQSVSYTSRNNFPDPADAGSRVERKGVIQFLTAAGKTVNYSIPAIQENMLRLDGSINEDMPAMQALVNAVVAVDAIFSDSNGVDITAYKGGYERFRRTTRAGLPTTRRPDADIIP